MVVGETKQIGVSSFLKLLKTCLWVRDPSSPFHRKSIRFAVLWHCWSPNIGWESQILELATSSVKAPWRSLCKKPGLPTRAGLRHGKCGLKEIEQLSCLPEFRDFQVRVYNKARQNMLSLKINPTETERILSLYYHDEHFDVITKDNAFLGHSFYCTKCDRAYKANPHVCETRKCTQCKNFCKPSTEVIKCQFCLRYFKWHDCYDRHRHADDTSLSTCQKWKKCKVCYLHVSKDLQKEHVCLKSKCKTAITSLTFTLTNATFNKLN